MTTKELQKTILEVEQIYPIRLNDSRRSANGDHCTNPEKFWDIKFNCIHPILITHNPIVIPDIFIPDDIPYHKFITKENTFFCPICRHYGTIDEIDFFNKIIDHYCVYISYYCLTPKEFTEDYPYAPYSYKSRFEHGYPQVSIMRYAQVRYQRLLLKKAKDLILAANPNLNLESLQIYLQTNLQKYMETEIKDDATNPTLCNPPIPRKYIEDCIIVETPSEHIEEINSVIEENGFPLIRQKSK